MRHVGHVLLLGSAFRFAILTPPRRKNYPGATPIRDLLFSEVILHAFQTVCQRDPWLDLDCFELQRVSGDCEGMKKVSHVTVSGNGGRKEMVSHVTVAGMWRMKGQGVTCNGFWGWRAKGNGVTCNGLWHCCVRCFGLH